MSNFNPQWITGKKIASVEMRRFSRGLHNESRKGTTTDPVITFEDGSQIQFEVCETEVGEYGVEISYWTPKQRGARGIMRRKKVEGA